MFQASISTNIPIQKNQKSDDKTDLLSNASNFYELQENITWGGWTTERAYDMTTDDYGNLYIMGETWSYGAGYNDAFIVKYDRSGKQLWNNTWGGSSYEYGRGIAVDEFNNSYIVGYTKSFGLTSYDMFIVKYNNSGKQEWNNTWDDVDGWDDYAYDVATDSSGNAYIVGRGTTESGGSDAILVKYDQFGVEQWVRGWGGINATSNGYGIIIDGSDNIYITGENKLNTEDNQDVFLAKYDTSGTLIDDKIWGGSNDDSGWRVRTDNSDNIVITGVTKSYGSGNEDILILKYDSSMNLLWNSSWGELGSDFGRGLTINDASDIFVAGYDSDDAILLKFNSTGDYQWNKTWGGSNSDMGWGVVNDKFDNIYLGGTTYSLGSNGEAFMAKYVENPISSFILDTNYTDPYRESCFLLNWSNAQGADNYSIYRHDDYIVEIENNGTLIAKGITDLEYELENYSSGDNYFIVYAINELRNRSSNCLHIEVKFPPKLFILDSNVTNPDEDGNFKLNWSSSQGADNYSLYHSTDPDINETDNLIIDGLTNSSIIFSSLNEGSHYFRMEAFNRTGFTWSNELLIIVDISSEELIYDYPDTDDDDEDKGDEDEGDSTVGINLLIPLILFCLMGVGVIGTSYIFKNYK